MSYKNKLTICSVGGFAYHLKIILEVTISFDMLNPHYTALHLITHVLHITTLWFYFKESQTRKSTCKIYDYLWFYFKESQKRKSTCKIYDFLREVILKDRAAGMFMVFWILLCCIKCYLWYWNKMVLAHWNLFCFISFIFSKTVTC